MDTSELLNCYLLTGLLKKLFGTQGTGELEVGFGRLFMKSNIESETIAPQIV